MSLIKQLIPPSLKFSPASSEVNWTRIETLVHGPGAGDDTTTVNSAVFACLMAIATAYPEPELAVYRKMGDGNSKKLTDHPLQDLLDMPTPNGELSMEEILFWTAWAKHIDGNAYWLKVRSGNERTGNVVELWPISPTRMGPITREQDFITAYQYQDKPNHVVEVPVENVIHFRLGLDDRDMRRGLSPLKALARHISSDDEAEVFVTSLLKNYAVPGLVVTPTGGATLNEDDAERITEKLRRKFGNSNRGNIAVMSKDSKIEAFGFSPKDLDMSIMHRIPEERISAVMQVPAIVAGLGAGLDRATYDNARSMGEWFTERKMVPQWRADGKKLNTSLRPDFASNPRVYIAFDVSNVRALQEDEDTKYTRLATATKKAFMTRNEARSDIGLDPIEGWDDEDTSTPEPVPPALAEANAEPEEMPAEEEQPPAEDGKTALSLDLARWQRKAEKRITNGSAEEAGQFVSDVIPAEQAEAIRARLMDCKSVEDVRAAFAVQPVDLAVELRRTNALLEQLANA